MLIRKGQPEIAEVHIDQALTQISVAYIQSQANFVSMQVFPVINVDKQTDKYYIFTKNDWFRDEAQKRGDNQETAGGGFSLSNDSYYADVWGFHKDLGYQLRANADRQVNLERGAVQLVTQRLLLRQEIQWVTDFFVATPWATNYTGVAGVPGGGQFRQWSDYVNSTPITDIKTAKRAMLQSTGFEPNTLVLGYEVADVLMEHPDLFERIKYGASDSPKQVTLSNMASLFGIDRVIVPKAIKATNQEGQAEAYDFVHGKGALLMYVNPTPEPMMPSAGYTFAWTGVSAGLGTNIAVDSFYIRHLKTTRYEAEVAFDCKAIASDLGNYFATAIA